MNGVCGLQESWRWGQKCSRCCDRNGQILPSSLFFTERLCAKGSVGNSRSMTNVCPGLRLDWNAWPSPVRNGFLFRLLKDNWSLVRAVEEKRLSFFFKRLSFKGPYPSYQCADLRLRFSALKQKQFGRHLAHSCNLSTREAETGSFKMQVQSRLNSKSLSQELMD